MGAQSENIGLTLLDLGILLGLHDVSEAFRKPVFGALSDRIGTKPVIVGGLTAFAVLSLIGSACPPNAAGGQWPTNLSFERVVKMILQTARFSRITTATGLFAGAAGMLTGMALSPWEPEDSAASMIQTISANPVQGEVAPLFLHYGMVFLSISVLGLLTMVRHRAVIWGRAAGLLAFVGLVNMSGLFLVDWFAIALGQSGLPIGDAVGILEKSATPILMAAWQIPGLIGVYFGLPLFLLALWRNDFVPWWPAVAVVAFIIASVILPPTLAFSVLSAVPYAAALSYVGWKTLSMDDGAWAEREQPSPAAPTS